LMSSIGSSAMPIRAYCRVAGRPAQPTSG
jgi:hypothetical protein